MRTRRTTLLVLALVAAGTLAGGRVVHAGNIDATSKYAWGENIGWLNFGTSQGDVTVGDSALTGYAWGENVGWISLNCSNTSSCATVDYKVANDGTGTLTGHAWGENVGWIVFNPTGGGVSIDSSGNFSGYAWGENVGWIVFNCATTSSCATVSYKVATTWTATTGAPQSTGGDTTPPSAPRSIQATATATAVTLTWNDPPENDVSTIEILRNTPPSTAVGAAPIASVAVGAKTYTDNNLTPSTAYTYLIRAVDTSGNRQSSTIIATTASAAGGGGGGGGGGAAPSAPVTTPPAAPPRPTPPTTSAPQGTAASATLGLAANAHVRAPAATAVYAIGKNRKRYTYPNEVTYRSWHGTFANVGGVSNTALADYALGGIMTIRGGTLLVKIESDPRVYAVEPGGILRWVETETRAKLLYGADWSKQVVDVPVSFWPAYTVGAPLGADIHPTGTLLRTADGATYYTDHETIRRVSTETFATLGFQKRFVRTLSPSITYAIGPALTTLE